MRKIQFYLPLISIFLYYFEFAFIQQRLIRHLSHKVFSRSSIHYDISLAPHISRQPHPLWFDDPKNVGWRGNLSTDETYSAARTKLDESRENPRQALLSGSVCWQLKLTGIPCGYWSYRNSQTVFDVKNKVNNSFVKILLHKLVENQEEEKILVELNEKEMYLLLYRYKIVVAEY